MRSRKPKSAPPTTTMLTNDPVELAFLDLEHATRDLIDGVYRLALIGGPPGIGKSRVTTRVILEYANAEREKWERLDLAEKLEDKRRTIYHNKAAGPEFVPPYTQIPGGKRSLATLFCAMYWCSYPGEIGIIDDVPAVRYKLAQELLNDACDEERNGRVACDIKALPDGRVPEQYQFKGSLLVVHNWTPAEVKQFFHPRVLSRAYLVNFPSDPEILFQYVFHTAITKKSLMPYLTAMNIPALGGERGLGLSQKEAEAVLTEIGEFYYLNRERQQEHSFRALRQWAAQRVRWPDHWKRRAEKNLGPWPR